MHEKPSIPIFICSSSTSDLDVTIDGATCTVTSANNTQLECVTGPHMGSVDTKVEVEVSGNGIAEEVSSVYRSRKLGLEILNRSYC